MIQQFNYTDLVSQSLHLIVYRILTQVAQQGLVGDQHFYISFYTNHPHISLPASLKKQYPYEMTIVLQYQYDALEVNEKAFSVILSFNGVKHKITVPYSSLIHFSDPNSSFNLQFLDKVEESNEEEKLITLYQHLTSGMQNDIDPQHKKDNVIKIDEFK